MRAILVVLAAVLLSACSGEWISNSAEQLMDDETRELSERILEAVQANDDEALFQEFDGRYPRADFDAAIGSVYAELPDGQPVEARLVGYQRHSSTNGSQSTRTTQSQYLLETDNDVALVTIRLIAENDAPLTLQYFNATRIDPAAYSSPETLTLPHYIFGAGLILNPLFIIATIIFMFRLKRVKRRIIWTIFLLIGCYPVFSANWSTGEWMLSSPGITQTANGATFNFIAFTLLGAGFIRTSEISPWMLQLAVPLGALIFWIKYATTGITRKPPKDAPVQPAEPGE